MKRVLILIIGLLFLVYMSGCSGRDEFDIYGTYKFEEVTYLWPLSSSTIDSVNGQMKDTKYTIQADLFKIESPNDTLEITSPKYVRENIPKDVSALSDVKSFIKDDVDYQYSIYDKNGNPIKWRLYLSSKCLWIGDYVDNTKDGSEVIKSIYKISK